MKFPVSKFMTERLVVVKADDLLEDAYKKLKTNNIRHLPVLDDCGDIIGVISDRDFQRGMLQSKSDRSKKSRSSVQFLKGAKVSAFMTWPVKTVSSSESLIDVCKMMIHEKISALVVTDKECVIGIITHEDLLQMLVESLIKQEKNLVNKVETWVYNSPIGQISKFLSDAGI